MKNVIVIGGGAAGMMAAIAAAGQGASVTLLEKNEKLGKKIFITGKGRCNVTNDSDTENLLRHTMTNHKFLYTAFYSFDSRMMMDFLEGEGLRLKTERGARVFPLSDKSSDVVKTLSQAMDKSNVKLCLGTKAESLVMEDGKVRGVRVLCGTKAVCDKKAVSGVKAVSDKKAVCGKKAICDERAVCGSEEIYRADKVIVATGGMAYPATGSTGDGYRFAGEASHSVTKTVPSLVPVNIKEQFVKDLQGLSLRNVKLVLNRKGKVVYEELGEMLFTHFGISGPLVLTASTYIAGGDISEVRFSVDLKPGLPVEKLDERIQRDFNLYGNSFFKNSLGKLLPSKLIPVIVKLSGIPHDKKVNEVTRQERQRLVKLLKNLEMTPECLRGFDEAVITRGGVNVREINPSTMESKIVKGLYFAGEVLDVDATTGGYNLQIAWSTGYLAGLSAGAQVSMP